MKTTCKKWSIIVIILFASMQLWAQGKAFESVKYKGELNGRWITLSLANGYIGASSVQLQQPGQKKPVTFAPEAGVPDENNQLKFIPDKQNNAGYFIFDNMKEAYDTLPNPISATYFLNNKKISVKVMLDK